MVSPKPTDTVTKKIEVDDVTLRYDISDGTLEALQHVTFDVAEGEFVCVIGPSGCGKSTLLYIIAGLLAPTLGAVRVDGRPVTSPGADRAMVFQKDAVFPWLTVADNVEYGLKIRRVPRAQRKETVDKYLELVGLSKARKLYPRELSGGMRKRVDMARAFANEPSILLMDEPYGSLDAMTKEHLQAEVLRMWSQSGNTVCFVTHDLEEALLLADRIVMLMPRPGRLAEIIDVPFPRPRDVSLKTSRPFQDVRRQLTESLGRISSHQT